jgi:hypothetical protein
MLEKLNGRLNSNSTCSAVLIEGSIWKLQPLCTKQKLLSNLSAAQNPLMLHY